MLGGGCFDMCLVVDAYVSEEVITLRNVHATAH